MAVDVQRREQSHELLFISAPEAKQQYFKEQEGIVKETANAVNFTGKMRAEEEKDNGQGGGNKILSRERKGVQYEQHLSEVSLMERIPTTFKIICLAKYL